MENDLDKKANEPMSSIILHGAIPVMISLIAIVLSYILDNHYECLNLFQRAGSIVTLNGAYVAYTDARRSFKLIGGNLYINNELKYKSISLVLVVSGTIIWGYGDLIL